MSKNSSRVQSNLLQQNCFVRDVSLKKDLNSSYSDKSYLSLDELTTEKGIEFRQQEVSYPITPQYVNSFVDSSDYRRDPANAVANGVRRSNLGDVTGFQDVMKMDISAARALYSQLQKRFSEASKSVEVSKSVDVSKPVEGDK